MLSINSCIGITRCQALGLAGLKPLLLACAELLCLALRLRASQPEQTISFCLYRLLPVPTLVPLPLRWIEGLAAHNSAYAQELGLTWQGASSSVAEQHAASQGLAGSVAPSTPGTRDLGSAWRWRWTSCWALTGQASAGCLWR